MTRYLRMLTFIAVLIATVYFSIVYFIPKIYVISSHLVVILLPFIIAIILALLIEPFICLLMAKLKMKRGQAVILSMLGIFSLLGLISVLVTLRLVEELTKFSVSMPHYVNIVSGFITTTFQKGKILFFSLPPGITNQINDNLNSVTNYLAVLASGFAGSLVSFVTALPGAVFSIIVTVIATFFFCRDRRIIVNFICEVLPHPWGDKFLEVAKEVARAFISYIRAQSFLIVLTTIQAIIGMYIIGIEYALTIGFLVGFLDIIPVLGPAALFIPWAIWAFAAGNIGFGIKLVVLFVFLWLVRQLLEAKVVADNLGLHPLAVLAMMYIGLNLLGVPGLILGPVLLIAGGAIYKVAKRGR